MDGVANVARHQQTQINSPEVSGDISQTIQQSKTTNINDLDKELHKEAVNHGTAINVNSKSKTEDLVKQLNHAISPISTDVKFGLDKNDIYYVAVIDTKTDKMIRRFPAEKGFQILPKMKEVTGLLFDSKG